VLVTVWRSRNKQSGWFSHCKVFSWRRKTDRESEIKKKGLDPAPAEVNSKSFSYLSVLSIRLQLCHTWTRQNTRSRRTKNMILHRKPLEY